jgi:hypothetical protein
LSFAEIMSWVSGLISKSQARLDAWVADFKSIISDIKSIQAGVEHGGLDPQSAAKRTLELKIHERLESNGRQGERAHIFSVDELQCGISAVSLHELIKLFGIRPGGGR